jgi:hypothetical protein
MVCFGSGSFLISHIFFFSELLVIFCEPLLREYEWGVAPPSSSEYNWPFTEFWASVKEGGVRPSNIIFLCASQWD